MTEAARPDVPKILYHGTRLSALGSIVRVGIQPRGTKKSNDKSFPSGSDRVYLSDAFAIKFAMDAMRKSDTGIAVLEVDMDKLDHDNLVADDDLVAVYLEKKEGMTRSRAIKEAASHAHDFCPRMSLQMSGSCAHLGPIPSSAIRRVATVDYKAQWGWLIGASDVGTGPIAYKYTKPKHLAKLRWLFDDINEPEIDLNSLGDITPEFAQQLKRHFMPGSDTRNGINIMDFKNE